MKPIKPPTTYNVQLRKIRNRGCLIDDANFARRVLRRVNYYRFSAYFIPFLDENNPDKYVSGTNFRQVYAIYEFDRKLRNIVFSTIEEIELSLRSHIAYFFSHKYGSLGYMDANNFSSLHDAEKFERKLQSNIQRNAGKPFVQHHINEYDGQFPLWSIIELFTCGELSKFYSDMKTEDKKSFVATFCKFHYSNFESWLLCLTDLRNNCAHYSRLYYSLFPAVPRSPQEYNGTLRRDVYSYVMVLNFLQRNRRSWNNSFMPDLKSLIEEYNEYITLPAIGFPDNWEASLRKEYMNK